MSKKEILIDTILKTCDRLAEEPIDKKKIKKFIENRLRLHGRNGYLFYVAKYSQQVYAVEIHQTVYIDPDLPGAFELMADYILKSNRKVVKN